MSRRDPKAEDHDAAGEPFLQRWSRLKSSTLDRAQPGGSQDDTTSRSGLPESLPAQSTPMAPEKTVLPDLESLGQDSDYSAFLRPDVDVTLRRAALRKLFHSPKFNVLDGLDDYCDDFTQFAPLAGIVTADMRHHLERAARELVPGEAGSKPRPSTDDVPTQRLPDVAADTATMHAASNGAATAVDPARGDTASPATEEPEEHADRRPA